MRLFGFLLLLLLPCALAYADSSTAADAMNYADGGQWQQARRLADQSGEPALISLIEWRYLLDDASGAGFDDIIQFLQKHPNWPAQSALQQRAEQALRNNDFSENLLLNYFDTNDPITGIGKVTLAGALAKNNPGQSERIHRLIHEGWVQGDFDPVMESYIRENYSSVLTKEDDEARMDRLLWDKQTSAAARMLAFVPASQHALYEARIALIKKDRKASALVAKVPASQQNNQGLIFDRLRYRAQKGDDKGVGELLSRVKEAEGYQEKWWTYRQLEARQAIKEGEFKTAALLVHDYDKLEGGELSEALWLEGWLALEYNGKPADALAAFSRMYDVVNYPVSQARAAYWAGRAAEQLGNDESARGWYQKATANPTTYYGQLAAIELNQSPPDLPNDSVPAEQPPQNVLEQAIKLCIETGEYQFANKLLGHAIAEASSNDDMTRLAAMGYHAGVTHVSVNTAKKALQKHLILTKLSYPRPDIDVDIPIERALMLAITRQESEFDREAESPAGAMGMMQLLPSSARYIARKIDMPYSRSRLETPEYNITLGSHYLGRLIDAYDGSYVLAIAAYNAGPGNVSKWVKLFGRPSNRPKEVINWVERIPFTETRNYVQRVLENLQVYRRLENPESYRVLMLEEDLQR